ncbi:MAG TPA: WYL domain-containing protein [Egibacteraceae bacterium]|nr:WYL domain-containing protein [Egibacteraceae bacterium]
MTVGVDRLTHDEVREALRLLGVPEPPSARAGALRSLRGALTAYGTVRSLLDRAPEGARPAFVRLAQDGAAEVEELLGRGWWGRGLLPPPLDWLQRRALIAVDDDGAVQATQEARQGFLDLKLALDAEPARSHDQAEPVEVAPAAAVVIAPTPGLLDQAVAAPGAGLRSIAPTVAISQRSPAAVTMALRTAGVRLVADSVVGAAPDSPALPGTSEEAVGPRAVRALLERAVSEGRQLRLQYFASSRGGAATERVVDPWGFRDDLLHGYCHLRDGERTFAVDRIGRARLLSAEVEHHAP